MVICCWRSVGGGWMQLVIRPRVFTFFQDLNKAFTKHKMHLIMIEVSVFTGDFQRAINQSHELLKLVIRSCNCCICLPPSRSAEG